MTLDTAAIKQEATNAALWAATSYLQQHYEGDDWGACGFAWVRITPQHKGNTKLGKAERVILRELGFELNYTGKSYDWWNPSGLGCQSVEAKAHGANAAVRVLQQYGFLPVSMSRLD